VAFEAVAGVVSVEAIARDLREASRYGSGSGFYRMLFDSPALQHFLQIKYLPTSSKAIGKKTCLISHACLLAWQHINMEANAQKCRRQMKQAHGIYKYADSLPCQTNQREEWGGQGRILAKTLGFNIVES
jgi:hypothetical protein